MIFDVVFNQSPENMQADFGEVSVIQGPPGPPGDTTAADAAAKAAQKSAEVAQTAAQKAQAAAEASAQSAAQAAESVGGLADDLAALKTESKALKAETARTARSLDYLWKKSKGIIYDTETVTGAGSSVSVPSGAMDYAALRMVGGMSRRGRNLLNYDAWASVTTINGTAVFEGNGITITAAKNDAYTNQTRFPDAAQIAVDGGDIVTLTWEADTNTEGKVFIFPDGNVVGSKSVNNATAKRLDYVVPSGITYIAFRFGVARAGDTIRYRNIMIQINATTTDWEPYTNSTLNAPVDEVRVANAAGDNTNTYPIPQTVRDMCPDYGIGTSADCYNYIDFAARQYHHRVGQVDLGTLDWYDGRTATSARRMTTRRPPDNVKIPQSSSVASNTVCSTYESVRPDDTWLCVKEGIAINTGNGAVLVYDSAFAAAEFLAAFKTHITGVSLYYELATPETIDLSAVWPDDDFGVLRVDAGGTIGLHYPAIDNGFELAVPSETEIMVDVAKVVETDG